jgi:hypothetical protein
VEWEPICTVQDPAVPCVSPQVRVVANLRYKTPKPITLNAGRFRLELVRGVQTEDGFCQNLGGDWDMVNSKCDLSPVICATMGGTLVDEKCNMASLDLSCDEGEALQGFTMISGVMLPNCVSLESTIDPDSGLAIVPWNWNDPQMKNIPQEDVLGCVVNPGATGSSAADAGGLACNRQRPPGYSGTCYYRNTGNQSTSSWVRVGSGACKGGIYRKAASTP